MRSTQEWLNRQRDVELWFAQVCALGTLAWHGMDMREVAVTMFMVTLLVGIMA
jgi:hypothetical protein